VGHRAIPLQLRGHVRLLIRTRAKLHREDRNPTTFYYKVPQLPSWALPTVTSKPTASQAMQYQEPHYEPVVEQPELATKLQKARITAFMRSRGVGDGKIVDSLRDDFKVQGELTREDANRVLTEIKQIQAAEKAQGDDEVKV
jgi:hypothetical protein